MYYKNDDLWSYDVYPKVYTVGKESTVHIKPLGRRKIFEPDTEYNFKICAVDMGNPVNYPATGDYRPIKLKTDCKGGFEFKYTFDSEQQYFIRAYDENDKRFFHACVYAVDKDLVGRYPFIGDLHMHTTGSDGKECDEVVAANYRRYGYDFTVISDHERYYPSLHCIDTYKDVKHEMVIIPGEEVHLPRAHGRRNDIHIVNFGGEYSINSLVEGKATELDGRDISVRAIRTDNVPDIMSVDEFGTLMDKLCEETEVPEGIDAYPYVVSKWIFDKIKEANGLGIFAHPNWISDVTQVPEKLTDYIFEKQPFDAFEVLGGERYFEQNGFQTSRYYEERAKGRKFPIVGSTDSHCSLESNKGGFICSTIVFAPECERSVLIDSIKNFYSVAVDTISAEFRIVGESRLMRYACFLLKNYFPLHDELCYEEGRLMYQYVMGTDDEKKDAADTLSVIYGRVKKQREKYFDF